MNGFYNQVVAVLKLHGFSRYCFYQLRLQNDGQCHHEASWYCAQISIKVSQGLSS
jgi:hypothetical protein